MYFNLVFSGFQGQVHNKMILVITKLAARIFIIYNLLIYYIYSSYFSALLLEKHGRPPLGCRIVYFNWNFKKFSKSKSLLNQNFAPLLGNIWNMNVLLCLRHWKDFITIPAHIILFYIQFFFNFLFHIFYPTLLMYKERCFFFGRHHDKRSLRNFNILNKGKC